MMVLLLLCCRKDLRDLVYMDCNYSAFESLRSKGKTMNRETYRNDEWNVGMMEDCGFVF